jgi:adenylylsulfate kinase-like enzyme
VKTVWIDCDFVTLVKRDSKQLYKGAMLKDIHPDKINNMTGLNDPYEPPENPHLIINTNIDSEQASSRVLFDFIMGNING